VRQFVFGYASLVEALHTTPTREVRAEGFVADLRGHRREWAVAMDNSRDLPGYKYYVEPETRERPRVYVTFLDLEPDPTGSVNGVVFPVAGDETLDALDRRERNYTRRDVTEELSTAAEGRVWAYFGTPDARERHALGRSAGTAVVSGEYLERVRGCFAQLGAEELRRYDASTATPPYPVRKLQRIDLP
jgi:cation transport regulator ChaC